MDAPNVTEADPGAIGVIPILNWLWKVPVLLLLTVVAWIISPVLACFIVYAEESAITGFPSSMPGKPRAFLVKPLRIWQTQDAPVDEWWYGDYYPYGFWKTAYSQEDYDKSPMLRWWVRVMWLCRNAAYGFGDLLGYDGRGMKFIGSDIEDDTEWKSGKSMSQYWSCVNDKGQVGWCYRAKWYYTQKRCVMVFLGYKLFSDPTSKYVAMQFNPFKT